MKDNENQLNTIQAKLSEENRRKLGLKAPKERQQEIERGLLTMDPLCAILISEFRENNPTDQEIKKRSSSEAVLISSNYYCKI